MTAKPLLRLVWLTDLHLNFVSRSHAQTLAEAVTAEHLHGVLAAASAPQIVVLTHVPPFPEAALYQGKLSGADCAPFFICKATGEVLREAAAAHPERDYLILCGHTMKPARRGSCRTCASFTGRAEYRRPAIQRVLEF